MGYQIGDWHPSHDHLRKYLEEICALSPKCELEEYAKTHEGRALFYLKISDPENLRNQDAIRASRDKLVDPFAKEVDMDVPMVIYQGYSIHGNESSGASASLLVAYYLLAGEGSYLSELLKSAFIFIDPCYNPDGLTRFSTWANMHKHTTLTSDPNSREFNEVWPGGRTNHYWFDLNRDWLFNIHPSSKGRINTFQKWKPDILTDHHEMGTNSTFFFQPGVPSRTNPNTPQVNQDITSQMANYHRRNLDSLGCQYFSKERFDDYYYGKGSTYPDIQGCIGILFEQASARGHLQESKNGLLSFPFTIRNQFTTSMSTQRAALALKPKVIEYKRNFFKNQPDRKGSYVFSSPDAYKVQFFLDMLRRHDIQVGMLAEDLTHEGVAYPSSRSYVIDKNQRQSGLIKTIFEPVSEFRDSIFYDVSAWTVPFALDMAYADLDQEVKSIELPKSSPKKSMMNPGMKGVKGYLMDWSQYESPALLYKLLRDSVEVTLINESVNTKKRKLSKGTMYIPLPKDDEAKSALNNVIKSLSEECPHCLMTTEWSPRKKTKTQALTLPSVAMVVGEGINSYEAGSTWYQMDKRLRMPVTMLDFRQLRRADLTRYSVIILPDGRYREMSDTESEKLAEWVEAGGTLLAMRRSIEHVQKLGWLNLSKKPAMDTFPSGSKAKAAQIIGGAIFSAEINLEHPLMYGYEDASLPIFKRGTQFYVPDEKSPLRYADKALISGYASSQNQAMASGSAGLFCHAKGEGKIISLVDNPNFRGYWLGGSQLFANCLFLNGLLDSDWLSE